MRLAALARRTSALASGFRLLAEGFVRSLLIISAALITRDLAAVRTTSAGPPEDGRDRLHGRGRSRTASNSTRRWAGTERAPASCVPRMFPPIVAAATVAAEDRRFWWHHGVDPVAVLRAIKQNISEGSIVEGGSTITQQAAKLLLLRRAADRRRGWGTKLHEAVIALRLEHRLSKHEILALYLNLAAYGNQTTGFERASRVYFGVSSGMLTPAQAAFLAGLPQRPTTLQPLSKPDARGLPSARGARAHGRSRRDLPGRSSSKPGRSGSHSPATTAGSSPRTSLRWF